MKRSTASVEAKKRGRPGTGQDPLVSSRLPTGLLTSVESWAAQRTLTRSEAIRRLVELGLASAQPSKPLGKKAALKASQMAGKAIDRLGDLGATDEERESRKRRLLKGPKEFRDIRAPKAKG
jgi:hypothetical protein